MAGSCWRIASGLLLAPVAVAGLAGCGGGSSSSSSAATTSANGALTSATLRQALLTRVNGAAAAAPASSGTYSSMQAANSKAASGIQVTPKACSAAATVGFNSAALGTAPAAAVTFRVGTNGVSEVLIASSAGSASAVLAGRVPAGCTKYQGKVAGRTVKYGLTGKAVTGIGQQARELNVRTGGAATDNQWSLIYRGAGFVGTVTVIGPNASEAAVRELAQQAYAFAARALA